MSDAGQFTYFLNYILTNVVPCREISEIHTGKSVKGWLERQKYTVISSIIVESTFDAENPLLSKPCDFVVGVDPFAALERHSLSLLLSFAKRARLGCLFAIPTEEWGGGNYSLEEWVSTLEQLGTVVNVYNCKHWSLILVVK